MLTFTVDGDDYEYDQNKLDLTEAIIIKKELGLTIADYLEGNRRLDPEALKAMVWLAKRRAGEAVKLRDLTFDCMALIGSLKNDPMPGAAEPDPPVSQGDPTGSDNGMIRSDGAMSISELSPIT